MESAEARRARLKALREAAAGAGDADAPSAAPGEPVLKFRNYAVKDQKNIEHTTVEAAQAPEFVAPVVEPSVVQEVQGGVSLRIFTQVHSSPSCCFLCDTTSCRSTLLQGCKLVLPFMFQSCQTCRLRLCLQSPCIGFDAQ
jgi:hypothetical protein